MPVPGMPQRKRESEALPVRAFRSARRNRHLTVPLAVPAVAWTAGEIMHAYGMGGYAGIAGLVLAGSVWFFAPHKWTGKDGEPRWPEVWYARLSAAALWLWLWGASSLGATAGTDGEALGPLLLALSAAWGIPWYRHKRPRGMKKRERLLREWQAFWGGHAYAWGVGGSRVIEAEEKHVTVRLRIQLMPGRQSVQHVKGAVHLIESALEGMADIGMVRVQPVKGNPSQVDVFLKRENPLRDVIEWNPALAPRSVHDDAVLGVSETGDLVRAPMRTSAFVNGKTRSEKSNHLALRLAQLTGCPDDRQIVIDLKKRSARPLLKASAVDYVITGRDEARDVLRMLCAEIAARARDWDTGEEQALATTSSPAVHVMIDEANPLTSVTAGTAECARLLAVGASQGSGLEVYYEVYTQYGALEESVQTEQTRMNLPLRACYATETAEHGEFALGGGGQHDTSKLEEKGEFLLKLGPRARPERIRAPHIPHRLLEEITAANALGVKRPRLMLYCGNEPSGIQGLTWQEWWDQRHLRIDPAFRSISPQYAEAVERYGEPEAPSGSPSPAAAPALTEDTDTDTGAAVAARIAAETEGDDIAPTAAGQARARGAVARGRDAFSAALAAAGQDGISPADLTAASGMSRSWVHDMLARLSDRGAAVKVRHGRYAAAPGTDVARALRDVEAGDTALLGDEDAVRRLHLVHPAS
ncbi:MAG TPA: hypothetical protein VK586_23400 [Streptosporangiaceae bacterium]|nr:hypothetical protein [Streptosporangiaceae bacterium]